MFRTGSAPGSNDIYDGANSVEIVNSLRRALGLYSNALLIVASIILLYHLLIMAGETAHQGVVGGKRTNQVWAPMRLVIAIGLLVPLSSGLNSAQYATLQVIEWGSNMASKVWDKFMESNNTGAGTNPVPHMPDTGSIAREAAKIGACMAIYNYHARNEGQTDFVTQQGFGLITSYGTQKFPSLCGSIINFAGSIVGAAGLTMIINQMQSYAPFFTAGSQQFGKTPPAQLNLNFVMTLTGMVQSTNGQWQSGSGSAGTGWVQAGSYFLQLAAGGSNRVSGTDKLPIVIGPKTSMLHHEQLRKDFFAMAEWIVNKYQSNITGAGLYSNIMGDTVAGRKFVDLLLMFMDQLGVTSGLWSPGSVAFYINPNNSPLAELVDLGHRMIRTALDCVGAAVDLGVNEPQNAMYSAQLGSDKSLAFGPKSGLFWATIAIPVLSAFAGTLMTMGIMVGIFMPMLPFFKFVLSVMTWLAMVVETLVCAPLMALAYLTPYGEGFAGQKVEPSYHLIMHTFLRPVMTIFGLIAAVLLFNIAAALVTGFYQVITGSAGAFNGGMAVVTKLAFGNMYVSILYTCLNMSLKVMDTFAKHATRWIGGNAHEENMGDAQQAISMAAQGVGMMGQIGGSLGFHASGAAGQMLGHGGADAHNPHPDQPTKPNPVKSTAFSNASSGATAPSEGTTASGGGGVGGPGESQGAVASHSPSSPTTETALHSGGDRGNSGAQFAVQEGNNTPHPTLAVHQPPQPQTTTQPPAQTPDQAKAAAFAATQGQVLASQHGDLRHAISTAVENGKNPFDAAQAEVNRLRNLNNLT